MTHDDDSAPVAAVDLGSNSFHMVIGRMLGGQLSVVDRLRDPVRIAAGLDERSRLSADAVERMLASLGRFRERLVGIPPERIRAIGTNTLRKAREPRDLLERASAALGCPIEVISGHEEGRLIYLGVSHEEPAIEGRRLVVDIGGGSSEYILGQGFKPIYIDSLHMGCVEFSRRWFPKGRLARKHFRRAETAARLELETMERRYRNRGWADCVGSSGTINAVGQILREAGWSDGAITRSGVDKLRKRMIAAESLADIALPGLQPERAAVLAGGLAILRATFESLGIETMRPSKAALREGALHDLLGRIHREDVRDRTIRALSERYSVDQEQAASVERTALHCLTQVAQAWELEGPEAARLLGWAARTHEIGLAISYSGYHKHGAYILENSDMPGFSRDDQTRLAALVRGHRRRTAEELFAAFGPPWQRLLFRLCVLLRLSVRLNRTRGAQPLEAFELAVEGDGLSVRFQPGWIEAHPLTRADLEDEDQVLSGAGLRIRIGPDSIKVP